MDLGATRNFGICRWTCMQERSSIFLSAIEAIAVSPLFRTELYDAEKMMYERVSKHSHIIRYLS